MKLFLNADKPFYHFTEYRFNDCGKQSLFIAETNIDGICTGSRFRRNYTQRSVHISFVKKFVLCSNDNALRYTFDLFCHYPYLVL